MQWLSSDTPGSWLDASFRHVRLLLLCQLAMGMLAGRGAADQFHFVLRIASDR